MKILLLPSIAVEVIDINPNPINPPSWIRAKLQWNKWRSLQVCWQKSKSSCYWNVSKPWEFGYECWKWENLSILLFLPFWWTVTSMSINHCDFTFWNDVWWKRSHFVISHHLCTNIFKKFYWLRRVVDYKIYSFQYCQALS